MALRELREQWVPPVLREPPGRQEPPVLKAPWAPLVPQELQEQKAR